MKQFKSIKAELKTKNYAGEQIHLLLTNGNRFYLYHEDCNSDFELITNKIPYVLDDSELKIINGFLSENNRPKYLRPKFNTIEELLEYNNEPEKKNLTKKQRLEKTIDYIKDKQL